MADPAVDVVPGVDRLRPEHGPLFAVIGVFDGLHVGHRYLLGELVTAAAARDARPGVITFDSHPDEVIVGSAPPLLLDPAERIRMLGELGLEVVVVQHFDAALRATEYDDFVHRISARARLAGLLMTPDAAFGHDRRGTPDALVELGRRDGFDVVVVPPFEIDGRPVKSSDIRAAIAAGDLALVERLLGRPYSLVGRVDDRGTIDLGMPMALPPPGSYRVRAGDGAASLLIDESGAVRLNGAPGPVAGAQTTVEFLASA
jgi:riboflavin kinase/FMN adenylyltransferase